LTQKFDNPTVELGVFSRSFIQERAHFGYSLDAAALKLELLVLRLTLEASFDQVADAASH
jgi:hypothetical protein